MSMLYSIVGYDVPNSLALRQKARPEHIERLQSLAAKGDLFVAGPNPAIDTPEPGEAGMSGSIIIARFSSLQAAQQWASADPYLLSGVYARVEVKPFKQVLPLPKTV